MKRQHGRWKKEKLDSAIKLQKEAFDVLKKIINLLNF